jgi:hypothetical protein
VATRVKFIIPSPSYQNALAIKLFSRESGIPCRRRNTVAEAMPRCEASERAHFPIRHIAAITRRWRKWNRYKLVDDQGG